MKTPGAPARCVLVLLCALAGSGCVVVNQGEVGVVRRWGRIDEPARPPGLIVYEAISTDGLTDAILRGRAIEAFKQLSASPNAKVIITDGRTPLLLPWFGVHCFRRRRAEHSARGRQPREVLVFARNPFLE